MQRPILVILIGYLIGIVWGLYINISIVLLFLLFLIIYFLYKEKLEKYKKIIIVIIFASILANLQVKYLNKKYNTLYENVNECQVVATIISETKESKYTTSYKIKIENINGKEIFKNSKLLLYVKNTEKHLEYGDEISFTGTYNKPSGARNYKGFDYKEYLKTIKMYGSIFSKSKIAILKKHNVNIILEYINKLKTKITENINQMLPEETRGIALGMLIGNTEKIDNDVKGYFRDSSLSHILAISGMHVSYLVIGLTFVFERSRLSKRKIKIFTIICLIIFMILTGLSPSVVRAGIMGIIVLSASLFYRKADILTSISVSLLISLISNPFSINNNGLLLSYGGTIGIVLFEKKIEKILKADNSKDGGVINELINKIKQMLCVTFSAQIIIFPIMILKFNTISLTFFISNVLAGFLIGTLVICGYVLIVVSLTFKNIAKCGFWLYNILINFFLKIIEFCSKLPFSKIYIKTPNIILIIIYYLLILLIYFGIINLKIIQKNLKKIIVVILIIAIISNIIKIIPKDLKIYFIDVGQGDSTLILTPNGKSILIDGGGSDDGIDVGENIMLPYLLNRGITKIDYLIISHFDTDHVGGLLTIMDKLKVDTVIISKQGEDSINYRRFKEIVRNKKIKIIYVDKKDKLKIEKDIYFDILWPNNNQFINENVLNNNSIVCKLNYKGFSMLFTGDIEKQAENKILAEYKNNLNVLNSTVLKVAHHGSKTSSTKEFIEAVKPRLALIGVGENNKFGHPNDEVLERLENMRL